MEIFQRNSSAVVGALASSIKKQGAHGGVLPCALHSLSQNSSFFLRQLLCKLCIVAPPKLPWAAKDKLCCFSLVWNINVEQLSPECVFSGGLCTLASLGVLGPGRTWGLLCALGARCTCWGTKLVQLLRSWLCPLRHFCFSVVKGAWSPSFLVVASVGLLSMKISPAICWRLCCVFAEGTGMVKPLEGAEKLRFVLLDSGTFCE